MKTVEFFSITVILSPRIGPIGVSLKSCRRTSQRHLIVDTVFDIHYFDGMYAGVHWLEKSKSSQFFASISYQNALLFATTNCGMGF